MGSPGFHCAVFLFLNKRGRASHPSVTHQSCPLSHFPWLGRSGTTSWHLGYILIILVLRGLLHTCAYIHIHTIFFFCVASEFCTSLCLKPLCINTLLLPGHNLWYWHDSWSHFVGFVPDSSGLVTGISGWQTFSSCPSSQGLMDFSRACEPHRADVSQHHTDPTFRNKLFLSLELLW